MIDNMDFAILKALFPDAVEFRDSGLLPSGVPDRVCVPDYPHNLFCPDLGHPEFETIEIEYIPLDEVGPELYAGMSKHHVVFYLKGKKLK